MISHLGRYEIIGELGHGAMGTVYKAKDPLIDRVLAIKTISLKLALDEKAEYEARFYQEAKAAGRLSHPNILTVFDIGQSGDVAYIAMEFLQGRELRDILDENQRLPVSKVLDIVSQVALGLAYAHEHGIVHRDVKPSNIMVTHDGHVKITDFGIARMSSSTVQTQTGVVLGSPKYMSPEQVLGKSIDQRSDIFSLGVMLYEMLTGQAPFVGESINAVMYQTMNAIPALPSTFNPEVPAMLNFIITKALSKDLDGRYQNAKEFANDLRLCTDALPSETIVRQAPPLLGDTQTEESGLNSKIGLSRNFDSFGATMRLAAMTAAEADKINTTIKMLRPAKDEANQASPEHPNTSPKPKIAAPPLAARTLPIQANKNRISDAPRSTNNGKLLLILIVLLLLLGLAFFL